MVNIRDSISDLIRLFSMKQTYFRKSGMSRNSYAYNKSELAMRAAWVMPPAKLGRKSKESSYTEVGALFFFSNFNFELSLI